MGASAKIGRSGTYVDQTTGYAAFIPNPLPPHPPVNIDQELQTLLSKADRALGRLDGSIQTLPDPKLFVFMYVRKEAVLSSQIEGTQSSLNDILSMEARVLDPDRPDDVSEVLNYVNAMNFGMERLENIPISGRLVREIHERLLQGVRGQHGNPGEFRTSQNWIGTGGCSLADAIFVPPPPDKINDGISDLERFIHDQEPLPLLLKIGLIHAQFETIHPFVDGNGRVGRLLITFLLCQQEILQSPVLYISHYFKKHQQEYYRHLQAVRDDGGWENWLKFFVQGIAEVSNEATATARNIVAMREAHREKIITEFGRTAGNGLTVLESLFNQPIVNVDTMAQKLGVTYQAANNLAQRFVDAEILEEISGQQRYRMFRYSPYVSIFSSSS